MGLKKSARSSDYYTSSYFTRRMGFDRSGGMISLRGLGKPQYLFRPGILLRRLGQEVCSVGAREVVRLPWGLHIEVITSDVVGMGLARQGLSDIVTTEILWRLTNPGDRTID